MNLTEEMHRAITQGESVELVDPKTEEVYVLVKREEYEKMRRLLEAEETDPSLYEVEELELFDQR